MIDLVFSYFRTGVDLLNERESAEDIERELNTQFHGKEYSVSSYQNEQIDLTVEAIHARPKYFPKEEYNGVSEVEGNNFFTKLENERTDPVLKEKLWASLTGQWITILRLNICNGDAESIVPAGLNLGYITATTSMRYQGYDNASRSLIPVSQIRLADTNDLQSDKLEIKIQYDGSMGDYANRISDSIDLLQNLQNEMEYYAMIYLLDLHDSGQEYNKDEFCWPDEESAQKLSEFLFDDPIGLKELEQITTDVKADLTEIR